MPSQIIGTFLIFYNGSDRVWELHENGRRVKTYPPGDIGKETAVINAIEMGWPAIYGFAKQAMIKEPHCARRIWDGALLVINKNVLPGRPGNRINEIAQVESGSSAHEIHSIQQRDTLLCTCEDFQFSKAPRMKASGIRLCKHIFAVLLAIRVGQLINPIQSAIEITPLSEMAEV